MNPATGSADRADDGILIERDGEVLRIRIDRPERKGSLTMAAVGRITDALEAAGMDDGLRVVVLSSTGPDFCTGSDWVSSNRTDAPRPRPGNLQRRTALQAHRLVAVMLETQLPIVCSVRGWAAGLGCQLALASDFTVATEDSRFWLPFTKRGFTPDSAATWLLPRLIGVARAKQLLMLGRDVTGRQAEQWGMIHAAVADDQLEAATAALVAELAGAATVALGLAKRCIHTALDGDHVRAMADEALALEVSTRTADFREGLAAFSERRDADFHGR